jgi:hypothetical protein
MIATAFPHIVFIFLMIFFQNYRCRFYFFNNKLVENYNYSFPHKILWIATLFSYMVFLFFYDFFSCFFGFTIFYDFFSNIFSKILLVDFIFLVLR